MKRIVIAIIALAIGSLSAMAQEPVDRVKTVSFTRLDSSVAAYAIGDVMKASKSADSTVSFVIDYPTYKDAKTGKAQSGYISSIYLEADTCNVANALFSLLVIDSTANSTTYPADNAAFYAKPAYGGCILDEIENIQLKTYGTTAAGSGISYASVRTLFIPFTKNPRRKLYFVLIAQGAYVPKAGGKFTLRVGWEL